MKMDAPIEKKPLEHCSLGEFLRVLASDATLPGAGAAGGIALALAAACAGKAVAITRHHADSTALVYLQTQLADLSASALVLAENDALQFKHKLVSSDPAATNALLRTDLTILAACSSLDQLLNDNARCIAGNMWGDWQAAHALSRACRTILTKETSESWRITSKGRLRRCPKVCRERFLRIPRMASLRFNTLLLPTQSMLSSGAVPLDFAV
jgi:hypothetical protein